MGVVVTVIVVLLLAWLYREYGQARMRRTETYVPAPPKPAPPRHQRVSDTELADQIAALRGAIQQGVVTEDEAVDSLVRTAGLEPDVARRRLRR
jgi:hypothetical protein